MKLGIPAALFWAIWNSLCIALYSERCLPYISGHGDWGSPDNHCHPAVSIQG
jgi:hypothetical protein